MNYTVLIETRAMEDLEAVVEWIAEDSERAARKWYEQIVTAIQTLEQVPNRCPLAPECGFFSHEIRHLLFGKRRGVYRILFTIKEDRVHVLHIRHGARDWAGSEDLELP